MLDNPFYCGKLLYNRRTNKKGRDGKLIKKDLDKVITVQGVHEPIVTENEWREVQKKRESLSKVNAKVDEPERISLLSGLVKCPVCGAGMIATKNKRVNKNKGGYYKTIHYYACNNSRKANGRTCPFRHTYNQEKLDGAVFEIIRKLSGMPEFKSAVIASSSEKSDVEKLKGI
ncbi:MAG: recombinase family protein [Ruminococcus sp.]